MTREWVDAAMPAALAEHAATHEERAVPVREPERFVESNVQRRTLGPRR